MTEELYKPPCICNGTGYIRKWKGNQIFKVQCLECGGNGVRTKKQKEDWTDEQIDEMTKNYLREQLCPK